MSHTYHPYDPPQWESDQESLNWIPVEPNFLQGTGGGAYPNHSTTAADPYQAGAYCPDDSNYTTSPHNQNPAYVAGSNYQYTSTYDNPGTSGTTFMPLTPANGSGPAYHGGPYSDAPYSPAGTTLGGYTASTVVGTPGVDSYPGESPNALYYKQQEAPSSNGTRPSGSGFQCPECDKTYPRRRDLDRHIHSRHPQVQSSASEYVTCPVCGRDNMRRDNWQRHMRHRHPTYQDTTNIRPRP